MIDQKINALQMVLKDLTEAGNNETKSSAGDKHETARAMMQLEQEKLGAQIKEWENQKTILSKIDEDKGATSISLGTYIESNNGNFFIAANIGKIELNNVVVMVISTQSPLGLCFLNRSTGEEFHFNKTNYQILKIS